MSHDHKEHESLQKVFRNIKLLTSTMAKVEIENLSSEITGPAIYACNHRSLSDLLIAGPTFHQWGKPIKALVAGTYFNHSLVGPLLRSLKCIPVEGTDAIDEAERALKEGWSVAMMPEGRIVPRNDWIKDGIGKGHVGIGRLAIKTGLPVIASGASGSELLWPRGKNFPVIKPWKRQKVVLCCEFLGPIIEGSEREITDLIMQGVQRCVQRAEISSGIIRESI